MRQLVAVAVVVALGLTRPAVAADPGVAARVNGVAIGAQDVQQLSEKIAQGAGAKSERVWGDALEQLVTLEVLVQAAQAEHIAVSKAEVDQEINDLKATGDGAAFRQALSGASEADLRKEVQRSLIIEKLLNKHIVVKVTKAEVEQYYKDNTDQFERPQMVRASHILVRIQANDPTAARKQAETILERLRKGADFAKLAKELSQDQLTAAKGGDLGFFPERPTPVAEAAFKLKPGQISDIVQSPYGLHIIKVTDTRAPGVAPLAEISEEIQTMLEDERREDGEDKYIAELKQKAKIEILMPKGPASKAGEQTAAPAR